jgi:hypothetical protein
MDHGEETMIKIYYAMETYTATVARQLAISPPMIIQTQSDNESLKSN